MTPRNRQLNRRQLLQACGLTTAACFLPSLWSRGLRAADPPDIRRLLVFIEDHGTVPDNWVMRRGNPAGSGFSYAFDDPDPNSFSRILRPLHPYRQHLTVIEGMTQGASISNLGINEHNIGHLCMLSHAKYQSSQDAGGPSFEQVIASAVHRPDQIPGLNLSTSSNPWMGGYQNYGAGSRVPVQARPNQIFSRIFPNGMDNDDPPPVDRRSLITARQRSVLDDVAEEYQRVLPRLSAEDRAKLSDHRDRIRSLELRLTPTEVPPPASCEAPGPLPNFDSSPSIAELAELAALALACDRTRVVTIYSSQLPTSAFGGPSGVSFHEGIIHSANSDPEAKEYTTLYNIAYANDFKTIVDRLAAYSLLDSTAAVWLTEHGDGSHSSWDIPIVMAGSCGGFFSTGKYHAVPRNLPAYSNKPSWNSRLRQPMGMSHSHFYVSLMQAMGLESASSIGMTSVRAQNGSTIDFTGPYTAIHA